MPEQISAPAPVFENGLLKILNVSNEYARSLSANRCVPLVKLRWLVNTMDGDNFETGVL